MESAVLVIQQLKRQFEEAVSGRFSAVIVKSGVSLRLTLSFFVESGKQSTAVPVRGMVSLL